MLRLEGLDLGGRQPELQVLVLVAALVAGHAQRDVVRIAHRLGGDDQAHVGDGVALRIGGHGVGQREHLGLLRGDLGLLVLEGTRAVVLAEEDVAHRDALVVEVDDQLADLGLPIVHLVLILLVVAGGAAGASATGAAVVLLDLEAHGAGAGVVPDAREGRQAGAVLGVVGEGDLVVVVLLERLGAVLDGDLGLDAVAVLGVLGLVQGDGHVGGADGLRVDHEHRVVVGDLDLIVAVVAVDLEGAHVVGVAVLLHVLALVAGEGAGDGIAGEQAALGALEVARVGGAVDLALALGGVDHQRALFDLALLDGDVVGLVVVLGAGLAQLEADLDGLVRAHGGAVVGGLDAHDLNAVAVGHAGDVEIRGLEADVDGLVVDLGRLVAADDLDGHGLGGLAGIGDLEGIGPGAGEVALAGDGHGGGAGVYIVGIRHGVVAVLHQGLCPQLEGHGGLHGGAGVLLGLDVRGGLGDGAVGDAPSGDGRAGQLHVVGHVVVGRGIGGQGELDGDDLVLARVGVVVGGLDLLDGHSVARAHGVGLHGEVVDGQRRGVGGVVDLGQLGVVLHVDADLLLRLAGQDLELLGDLALVIAEALDGGPGGADLVVVGVGDEIVLVGLQRLGPHLDGDLGLHVLAVVDLVGDVLDVLEGQLDGGDLRLFDGVLAALHVVVVLLAGLVDLEVHGDGGGTGVLLIEGGARDAGDGHGVGGVHVAQGEVVLGQGCADGAGAVVDLGDGQGLVHGDGQLPALLADGLAADVAGAVGVGVGVLGDVARHVAGLFAAGIAAVDLAVVDDGAAVDEHVLVDDHMPLGQRQGTALDVDVVEVVVVLDGEVGVHGDAARHGQGGDVLGQLHGRFAAPVGVGRGEHDVVLDVEGDGQVVGRAVEHVAGHGLQGIRQGDPPQRAAVGEHAVAQRGDAVGDGHVGQVRVVREGAVGDVHHGIAADVRGHVQHVAGGLPAGDGDGLVLLVDDELEFIVLKHGELLVGHLHVGAQQVAQVVLELGDEHEVALVGLVVVVADPGDGHLARLGGLIALEGGGDGVRPAHGGGHVGGLLGGLGGHHVDGLPRRGKLADVAHEDGDDGIVVLHLVLVGLVLAVLAQRGDEGERAVLAVLEVLLVLRGPGDGHVGALAVGQGGGQRRGQHGEHLGDGGLLDHLVVLLVRLVQVVDDQVLAHGEVVRGGLEDVAGQVVGLDDALVLVVVDHDLILVLVVIVVVDGGVVVVVVIVVVVVLRRFDLQLEFDLAVLLEIVLSQGDGGEHRGQHGHDDQQGQQAALRSTLSLIVPHITFPPVVV